MGPIRDRLTPGDLLLRICYYPAASITARVLFDLRMEGTRAVPRRGPVIVVPNHQGYLDPFLLQLVTPRPIRYMMTSDFYDIGWIQPFFRLVRAIRIDEERLNRGALKAALSVLGAGGVVGIFPEGQLSDDGALGSIHPGVAFLAARSGAPVVPVRIRGSYDVFPRGRWFPRQAPIRITVGRPLAIRDRREGAERILAAWTAL